MTSLGVAGLSDAELRQITARERRGDVGSYIGVSADSNRVRLCIYARALPLTFDPQYAYEIAEAIERHYGRCAIVWADREDICEVRLADGGEIDLATEAQFIRLGEEADQSVLFDFLGDGSGLRLYFRRVSHYLTFSHEGALILAALLRTATRSHLKVLYLLDRQICMVE